MYLSQSDAHKLYYHDPYETIRSFAACSPIKLYSYEAVKFLKSCQTAKRKAKLLEPIDTTAYATMVKNSVKVQIIEEYHAWEFEEMAVSC